jgi:hypothetical protein
MKRMIVKILLISSLIFSVHSLFAGPGMPAPLPPQKCPTCCDIQTDDCCNGSGCSGTWEISKLGLKQN